MTQTALSPGGVSAGWQEGAGRSWRGTERTRLDDVGDAPVDAKVGGVARDHVLDHEERLRAGVSGQVSALRAALEPDGNSKKGRDN